MNTKEVQALESYFKTENEHWNVYAFKTIRKALEKQLFSDFNKLMPYVLPKTESVKHTLGEPEPPKKNWFD